MSALRASNKKHLHYYRDISPMGLKIKVSKHLEIPDHRREDLQTCHCTCLLRTYSAPSELTDMLLLLTPPVAAGVIHMQLFQSLSDSKNVPSLLDCRWRGFAIRAKNKS